MGTVSKKKNVETQADVFRLVLEDMADDKYLVPSQAIVYWAARYSDAGKVTVPREVYDVIKAGKEKNYMLEGAMSDAKHWLERLGTWDEGREKQELFARAWVAWPKVEAAE